MTGADPTLRHPGCYLAFIWSADALRLKKKIPSVIVTGVKFGGETRENPEFKTR